MGWGGWGRGGRTVFLGNVAEVLEELAAELVVDQEGFGPSCGGRAGDVAEAVPVAGAGDQGPEDEGPDRPDGDGSDGEGHCSEHGDCGKSAMRGNGQVGI